MASRGLGTLTLDLVAKIAGFEAGMDKAARHANKRLTEIEKRAHAFGRGMGTAMRSAAGGLLAFAGVTVSVAAGINAIKSAIDRADSIRDLSIRLGISTEKLSGFSYAAKQTGTDIEDLNKGLLRLSKNMTAAIDPKSRQANLFASLGLDKSDLGDLEKALPKIADGFKSMEDGFIKNSLAQELFGKSGSRLIEFLNQGSDGLDDFAKKAKELGLIISQDTANAADDFNDKLEDLKSVGTGLATQIAGELLPQLTRMVEWAIKFVNDGDNAKTAVDNLVVAFDGIVSVGSSVISTLESIRSVLGSVSTDADDSAESLRQLVQSGRGLAAIPASMAAYFDAVVTGSDEAQKRFREAKKEISAGFSGKPIPSNKINLPAAPWLDVPALSGRQPFSAVPTPFVGQTQDMQKRLADFYRHPTPSSPKGKKSGKSDAEKEAEKIAKAIEQMTKAQQEWQNELTKTGNPIADEYASRLREITEQAKGFAEDGVPAEKVKAFTDEMQKLAASLRDSDIAEFQKEFNEATEQMAANMQGPMQQALLDYQVQLKEIDDLLKLGIITLEEYNARLAVLTQQRDAPATGLLDAIREEIKLLGMSAEQQEIYNNLKRAGVEANDVWGQSVIASTEALQAARESAERWSQVEGELSGTIFNLAKNFGDAENIIKDFGDSIADIILRSIAEDWAGTITDWFKGLGKSQGSSGSSSTGGTDWGGLISSIFSVFGGGKASGGSVSKGMFYPVNERGTELLSMGGKDYLMMGSAGRVTPAHALGGGGSLNQTNNFMFAAPTTGRTQTQVAAKVGFQTREASRRNG